VRAPIVQTSFYYRIETEDMVYVVVKSFTNWQRRSKQRPLNVTLNGKTKIFTEGTDAQYPR
jgi:hypothetical protein